jgi:hypothetical protein
LIWRLLRDAVCRSAVVVSLASIAGVGSAQSDKPWDGIYVGVNAGEARNNTRTSSTLNGATIDSASAATFSSQYCPSGGIVGGVQLGKDFQTRRLIWGVGADLDAWSAKNHNPSLKYAGASPPPGTYVLSGKLNPNDFAVTRSP